MKTALEDEDYLRFEDDEEEGDGDGAMNTGDEEDTWV